MSKSNGFTRKDRIRNQELRNKTKIIDAVASDKADYGNELATQPGYKMGDGQRALQNGFH